MHPINTLASYLLLFSNTGDAIGYTLLPPTNDGADGAVGAVVVAGEVCHLCCNICSIACVALLAPMEVDGSRGRACLMRSGLSLGF